MKVRSIASALPSLWLVIAVFSQSLARLDVVGMPFWEVR
jgi:hypothetical protein